MPVSEVNRVLSWMWQPEPNQGRSVTPSIYRACQMTVVLHFGIEAEPEDARAKFDIAIRFAQRYPCRIVVLCPERGESGDVPLDAKLFCQCYLGESLRSRCCCEALVLGYPLSEVAYLEDQISLWVQSDLPLYYWLHRVPPQVIEEHYFPLLKGSRKVVYDSHIEGNAYDGIPWPIPQKVADFTDSRILPIRQCIGRFLGSYDPAMIAGGLKSVQVAFSKDYEAEANSLLKWQWACLASCGAVNVEYALQPQSWEGGGCLRIEWSYADSKKSFAWSYDASTSSSHIQADWGVAPVQSVNQLEFLSPEVALAEAFFF